MNPGIIGKYIIANLIDLGIPLFPVIIGYFYKHLVIFEYLGFFELLAIVFFIFSLISLIGNKANTVGSNISKIYLKDLKTKKINIIKNLVRIILISMLLFFIGDLKNLDITALILFIIVMTPIPIRNKGKVCLSILNCYLGIGYEPMTG